MAKTLKEAAITTPNARAKLAHGAHWKSIDPEVHLGYRKGKRGGVWLVRWRVGIGYKQSSIGTADDAIKTGTLDYHAAVKQARATVETARQEAIAAAAGPVLTVAHAVESYIAARDARDSKRAGREKRSDGGRRLSRYVLGQPARGKQEEIGAAPLAAIPLHALKESDLLTWRADLSDGMKASSRQRLINDLKAALNSAYAANRDRLDPTFPGIVKHGLRALETMDDEDPIARENQILPDSDIARLLRAAREVDQEQDRGGDLFRLVLVLAATGARFSQVARLRVGDCQIAASRLLIPVSRKGRGGKSGSITVPVGRDIMDALVPVVTGRKPDEFLLERWRWEQRKGSIAWYKGYRGPWQSSSEIGRPWQAIRDAAGMADVIPYALRHSSIVRGIKANLPIRLVAALHDTSVKMIEDHYSAHVTDGLEDMARAAIVPMMPTQGNVITLRGAYHAE
ncbi:tyrosine-type recombinase/integrase [Aquibium oceanicum]|uniref:Integrase n=1 Tax=Aquibium oceanicum TaxID=1670800 RepID=A0A1L3SXD9_9HYPH|nr:tyrosine-type recombinase/integrase [Aquibium oceanicum]APH74097.1 integrase [Aquibium oceanicum]